MRYFKDPRLATCWKSGIVTDVTGWCGEWKHINKKTIKGGELKK